MDHSSITPPTNKDSHIQHKRKRNTTSTTMMTRLTKVCNTCFKLSVEFDLKAGSCDDEHASIFKSYVALLGPRKESTLINNLAHVPFDVKKSIWTDLKVLILTIIYMTIYILLFCYYILIPTCWCKCIQFLSF